MAPDISEETVSYYYSQKPNMIFGSPAFLDLTIKNIPDDQDLSSVTFFVSGGDFLSPSHAQRGVDFFATHGAENVVVGNGFGNAELVSIGSTPVGSPVHLESAGKVLVGSTAMVIDPDTKEEKKYGEEGILCIAGRHVFKEYYEEPELTKEVLFEKGGELFFNTGTYAIIDAEGYLTITSRLSRFYIMSTLNKVYCDNVQSELCKIDCVYDAAVVKVQDSHLLYVNKAYIVIDQAVDTNGDPIEYIQTKLPGTNLKQYEYPTYYEIVKELPRKQGTEKVDYMLLEKMAETVCI